MGRQIQVLLSRDDEQRLLDLAHKTGFILVCGGLRGPDLVTQQIQAIPSDDEAEAEDYNCYLIPEGLAKTRQATLGTNPNSTRPYFVTSKLPYIDWQRTRRPSSPERTAQNRANSRLHVSSDWDYGDDQLWLHAAVRLYDSLVKLVKKLTVKVDGPPPRYVSRQFDLEVIEQLNEHLARRPGRVKSGVALRSDQRSSSAS